MATNFSQSPLSSAQLRHTPERFERILGLDVASFDDLVRRVDAIRLQHLLSQQVLWESDRVERLHRSTNKELAEQVCITLLYQRQYMMQEVLGAIFGIEQGSVSAIVKRFEPWILAALPTPEAISHRIADVLEVMPAETVADFSVVVIGDGAEQPRQRPSDAEEQKHSYSGKKNFTPIKHKLSEHPQG